MSWAGRCAALVCALLGLTAAPPATAQAIAITFDDLPSHSLLPPGETRLHVAEQIVGALKAAGGPSVYGFVNGVRLDEEPASAPVLPLWRGAGYPLGNHGWSHLNLNDHSAADFEADVVRNEPLLADLMGKGDWRWLRFPFLAQGETPQKRAEVRGFLAQRGYRIASVTLGFDDYAFNEPYARCAAKQDTRAIDDLETRYLAAARANLAYERGLSRTLFGRDIPYVLLMHLGAFDARMLPRLLALYRSEGASFITLEAAERDPFYRPDAEPSGPDGPTSLEAEMARRGLPLPAHPWSTASLDTLCR